MESPQFVRARLVNYTTADCSDREVKNNRVHYHLQFKEDIGWDWVEGQVKKASGEMDVTIEMWKIRPSGMQAFEVEVREVERREDIDNSQRDFGDFE